MEEEEVEEEVEEEHQVLCLSLEPVGRLVLLCLNFAWYLGCRSDGLGICLLEDLGLEEAEVVLADRPLDDGHEAVQESRYVGSGGRDLSQHQHFSLDETLGLRDYAYM